VTLKCWKAIARPTPSPSPSAQCRRLPHPSLDSYSTALKARGQICRWYVAWAATPHLPLPQQGFRDEMLSLLSGKYVITENEEGSKVLFWYMPMWHLAIGARACAHVSVHALVYGSAPIFISSSRE
jgi:hypothetical protein